MPSGTPSNPPTTNGPSRFSCVPRHVSGMAATCPTNDPQTAIGAASCESTPHVRIESAASENATRQPLHEAGEHGAADHDEQMRIHVVGLADFAHIACSRSSPPQFQRNRLGCSALTQNGLAEFASSFRFCGPSAQCRRHAICVDSCGVSFNPARDTQHGRQDHSPGRRDSRGYSCSRHWHSAGEAAVSRPAFGRTQRPHPGLYTNRQPYRGAPAPRRWRDRASCASEGHHPEHSGRGNGYSSRSRPDNRQRRAVARACARRRPGDPRRIGAFSPRHFHWRRRCAHRRYSARARPSRSWRDRRR